MKQRLGARGMLVGIFCRRAKIKKKKGKKNRSDCQVWKGENNTKTRREI